MPTWLREARFGGRIEGLEPSSANDGKNGAPRNMRDKRKKLKWFVLGAGTKSKHSAERRGLGVKRDLGDVQSYRRP